MTNPKELIDRFEFIINQNRCEIIAVETVLKVIITRVLPLHSQSQFLDEIEQQCLHSICTYEDRQKKLIQPQIEGIFSELKGWVQNQSNRHSAPEAEQ